MRTEIEKTKKKGQSYILLGKKEKRRRGKGMTTDDNPDIKRRYAISYGRRHGGVSKKIAKSQVWPPSGVTRAA
jgi:hypothetical protein